MGATQVQAVAYVLENLHGAVSAGRVTKGLGGMGISPDEAQTIIAHVAGRKSSLHTRAALKQIALGSLLASIPVALGIAFLLSHQRQVPILYGMVLVGLGMLGKGIWHLNRAKAFRLSDAPSPRPVAAGPRRQSPVKAAARRALPAR